MEPIDNAVYTGDHHPNPDDFARLDAGDMTRQEEETFFRHLDGCPVCKAAFEAWVQNGRPSDLNNDT